MTTTGGDYGIGPKRVQNKVAIVTGAGSAGDGIGNGRAAAILLARNGAKVCVTDIDVGAAERTRAMIEDEGGEAVTVVADVSATADCKRIVDETVQRWGRLDILVNNVGIRGAAGTAVNVVEEEWEAGLRINVTSMMLMAKFAIPEMMRNKAGSIINVSSVAGLLGGHGYLLYPTTKGAIIGMTRSMAYHHGPDGIRVNCICPGAVHTPLVANNGLTDEIREARRKNSMLKTEGTGWDVGAAVLYLASDDARWVTGTVMPVDAGLTAMMALASSTSSQQKS